MLLGGQAWVQGGWPLVCFLPLAYGCFWKMCRSQTLPWDLTALPSPLPSPRSALTSPLPSPRLSFPHSAVFVVSSSFLFA